MWKAVYTCDYCNQKRLNQPETDMLSAIRVAEKWRAWKEIQLHSAGGKEKKHNLNRE